MNEPRQLTVGSLFAGIGGFDLGLERAGMRVIWQSEINPYACAVLRKHWPLVPNIGDVSTVNWSGVPRADVIAGGFPCQAFSSAARGANQVDRNLWEWMRQCIVWLRPSWVIGENVAAIDRLELSVVEADLENLGYQVQTLEIPACAVGRDHHRPRNWILGYANRDGEPIRAINAEVAGLPQSDNDASRVGVSYGLPSKMDRMQALGNAIVPQIAEIIGRAIVASAI